jgi:hypothetical protein
MADAPLHIVKDEVDPELVRLRKRAAVGPLLAFSVLGFAVYLMVLLRADLVYSLEPTVPRELGRADDVSEPLPGDGRDNQHVAVRGQLDMSAAADLHGRHSHSFRLVPVLGTGGRFWIDEEGEAGNVAASYDDRFVGRLRPLDRTSFGRELRAWLARQPPEPRYLQPEALGPYGIPDKDVYGQGFHAARNLTVRIEERAAGTSLVTLVATDQIKDQAGATAALQAAGVLPAAALLVEKTAASWTFRVPGEPSAVHARLRAARLFGAEAQPVVSRHEGLLADLHVDGDAVTLAGATMSKSAIEHLAVMVPRTVPDRVWVLIDGETPGTFWYIRPLYAVLAVIALLMAWAGVRALRRARSAVRPHLVDD